MTMRPFAKKSLGQHWLDDQPSLNAIIDSASLKDTDTVLEIGPGPGSLTRLLVKKAGQVIAVELDNGLAGQLSQQVTAGNLQVRNEDILRFDFRQLPQGYKIVANIPYYLTGKLFQQLSETANPPSRAVLLVQKEVAERAAARPGAMSILSVTLQFYWQVDLGPLIPAKLFTPSPKVDSQVLILERRKRSLLAGVDDKEFFRLIKTGFAQPRKTMMNNLSAGLQRRPQTLSLEEWQQLYQALHA